MKRACNYFIYRVMTLLACEFHTTKKKVVSYEK